MMTRRPGIIAAVLTAMATIAAAAGGEPTGDYEVRWGSTGGGWRSMWACAGFANLFSSVGLLGSLGAVSTTSGASWLSTQLFYSPEFHRIVAESDPDGLYDFVLEWMESYKAMNQGAIAAYKQLPGEDQSSARFCNSTGLSNDETLRDTTSGEAVAQFCEMLIYYDGDWALYVEEMLRRAAAGYGDGTFVERRAEAGNRVESLRGTDLYVQAALVPNSRIRIEADEADEDVIVYVGAVPEGDGKGRFVRNLQSQGSSNHNGTEVYGVVLSAAYVVNSTSSHYSYSTESALRGDLLMVETPVTGTTSREFSFGDWDDFGLYPALNGSVLVDDGAADVDSEAERRTFAPAFGGGSSTVSQISAISSAALGQHSPLVPSVFAQAMSPHRAAIALQDGGDPGRFDEHAARMYDIPILDKFAVCGQWPGTCGPDDGMYIDGGFADGPTLATSVAQYQLGGGDVDRTLRVIITNTNKAWGTDYQRSQILQYFDSPSNAGVEPGGFVWHPGFYLPRQSLQIFEEALDGPGLDALLEPIDGSNMTTGLLSGTTIDSPSIGVKAGQSVEVLLINVNEPITTFVSESLLLSLSCSAPR